MIGESRLEEQLDKAPTRAETTIEKEIDVCPTPTTDRLLRCRYGARVRFVTVSLSDTLSQQH